MQDAYVGDVGDFGKLILLNHLRHRSGLKLGVHWCGVIPKKAKIHGIEKKRANDGKHTNYNDLRTCHPRIHDELEKILIRKRKIESLHSLLPNSIFFGDYIPETCGQYERDKWFQRSQKVLADSDLVFFDPDNGLSGSATLGGKHIGIADLCPFWNQGKSLLIYHHFSRQGSHAEQARCWEGELRAQFRGAEIDSSWHRRRSPRIYFLVINPKHAAALRKAMHCERLRLFECTAKEFRTLRNVADRSSCSC